MRMNREYKGVTFICNLLTHRVWQYEDWNSPISFTVTLYAPSKYVYYDNYDIPSKTFSSFEECADAAIDAKTKYMLELKEDFDKWECFYNIYKLGNENVKDG